MIIYWPLWWCISKATRDALEQYQDDKYGYRIEIPPHASGEAGIEKRYSSLEEIPKIMRQRTHLRETV